MAQKANGDYYYVESETVNDLIDDFALYGDGNGNLVIHDQSNDDEYKFVNGSGLEMPTGRGVSVGGDALLAAQQGALTAEDGSTVDSTYGTEEVGVIQTNRTRIAEIEAALQAHGLIA